MQNFKSLAVIVPSLLSVRSLLHWPGVDQPSLLFVAQQRDYAVVLDSIQRDSKSFIGANVVAKASKCYLRVPAPPGTDWDRSDHMSLFWFLRSLHYITFHPFSWYLQCIHSYSTFRNNKSCFCCFFFHGPRCSELDRWAFSLWQKMSLSRRVVALHSEGAAL